MLLNCVANSLDLPTRRGHGEETSFCFKQAEGDKNIDTKNDQEAEELYVSGDKNSPLSKCTSVKVTSQEKFYEYCQ